MLILPALFAIIAGCTTFVWLFYRADLVVVEFITIAASCTGLVVGLMVQQWIQG